MANVEQSVRQNFSALIGILALLLLLIVGAMLGWRSGPAAVVTKQPPTTGQVGRHSMTGPNLTGPVGKMSAWIEPPRSEYEVLWGKTRFLVKDLLIELNDLDVQRNSDLQDALDEVRLNLEQTLLIEESPRSLTIEDK